MAAALGVVLYPGSVRGPTLSVRGPTLSVRGSPRADMEGIVPNRVESSRGNVPGPVGY